jgi:lipopolysaccharide export system permease protein
MYRYSLYLMKNLAGPFLLITFSLTCIVWLMRALRFVDYIVNRGLSIGSFLYLTLLLLPSLLGFIAPAALFVAVLFSYHKLTMDSEMVVLRSAGLSRWQILRPALYFAGVVMLFGYVISLYLLPLSYRQFKDLQTYVRDNYASLLLQEEVFNTPVEGLTVFIAKREEDGTLKNILVHDGRIPSRPVTMMAEDAQLVQTPGGPRFYLRQGNRQEIDYENNRVSFLDFESYTLDISFYTKAAGDRTRDSKELFFSELMTEDKIDENRRKQLLAEMHERLSWPLTTPVLVLIALTGLLTGEFNRRGQWRRIAFTIGGAIGFLGVFVAITGLVVKYPFAGIMLYGWLALVATVCLVMLLRDRVEAPPAHATEPLPG